MAQETQTVPTTSATAATERALGQIKIPDPSSALTVPVNFDPNVGPSFPEASKIYQDAIQSGWNMPGARTPYMAVPAPNMRMPAPPMQVGMQDPQPRPTDTSVYARRTAKQQGFGNMLGNALGMIANKKNQQEYMNRVNTLEEYGKAKIREQEAQRVLKFSPNDTAAKQVLTDAQNEIQRMELDPKESKWLTDAMPNYTDPAKDKWAWARNLAWEKAKHADTTGTINDNQSQVATSDKSDAIQGVPPPPPQGRAGQPQGAPTQAQPQGAPPVPNPAQQAAQTVPAGAQPQQALPPAQRGVLNVRGAAQPTPPMGGTFQGAGTYPGNTRFAQAEAAKAQARQTPPPPPPPWRSRFQIPTELQMTPEYSAAMQQQQAYEKIYLEKALPEAEKAAAEQYKVATQQGNQNFRRIVQSNTELQKSLFDNITKANIADAKNQMELQKQAIASAAVVKAAQVRADYMSMALMSDPRFAPFAGTFAGKFTKQYEDQISKMTTQNSQLTKMVNDAKASLGSDPLHPGKEVKPGTPERARIEEQIRAWSTQIDNNNTSIKELQGTIEQVKAMAAGAAQAGRQGGGQGLAGNIDQGAPAPGGGYNLQVPQGASTPYVNGVVGVLRNPGSIQSGMNMTKNFEGYSPVAYGDAGRKGGRDIGFGHSIQPGEKFGSEIDVPTANRLFEKDYAQAQDVASKALGNTQIPAAAGAVLTDLAYQSGKVPAPIVEAIRQGDWNKAADLVYAQRTNSGPGAEATLTKRFGLSSQILRAIGRSDTSAAARAGADSTNQPATGGGAAASVRGKPSAAISVDKTNQARNAVREAFGTDWLTSPATVPTSPDYDATQDSSSASSDQSAEDTAQDNADNADSTYATP